MSPGPARIMVPRTPTSPVTLLALFAILSALPLATLAWLGSRMLDQEAALDAERVRDRLENGASLVTRELDRALSELEERLPAAARGDRISLPAGAVFLLVEAGGVAQQQGERLRHYPRVPLEPPVSSTKLTEAEALEFREGRVSDAIAAYREMTASRDERLRAEAMMRLARCLRKLGRIDEALSTYSRLAGLGALPVAGSPAELVAHRERLTLLSSSQRPDEATRERALLTAALTDGRYRIDRATFEYFSEPATVGEPPPIVTAVEQLWPAWAESPSGRTGITVGSDAFVSVWRRTPTSAAAVVASVATIADTIREPLHNLQVAAALEDANGVAVWGQLPTGQRMTRATRDTGLPWMVTVAPIDVAAADQAASSRRNLFLSGFMLMIAVVATASYFVFRSVNRELKVARLQSAFVAAVSHEFRTPLTAMCHLTEILEQGHASPSRLAEYYRALGKESRRLHTMVEDLLDFGRIDAGRRSYAFEDTDPVALVERVAEEYGERSPESAERIRKTLPPPGAGGVVVQADREALALAVRNLLDNALKYSPASAPVRIEVAQSRSSVAVLVEDRGVGIDPQERRDIFQKFTRGAAAKALDVKGTGIGLTMVDEIVKAHGGRLELDSEPGRGTTFTIVLPASPS